MLGLGPDDAAALNDDRVGRMLDRPFDADRASLITTTVLAAFREFDLDVTQLHNDSTTLTLTGAYLDADGYARGGKATAAIRHGHNKDYRPDLKQLLLILTVCADGAVPIAYRVGDGNTPDDLTHIPTWDELRALVGRADFLYVADSTSCSRDAMGHIASHQGRFVTVIPHGRREDTWFRHWAQTHAPAWVEAHRSPGTRLAGPDRVWRTFTAPAPSADGYRVIRVHSGSRATRDQAARAARIEAGPAAIDTVAHDAVTDGCFPLITADDTAMTPAQVLAAYRHQPNLERRHHIPKGPQQVAPVFLENAHRIEALLLRHLLALLTEALIEREIRTSMKTQALAGIPSTPSSATALPPAPHASWRSSATLTATTSWTATRSYRPSNPNSPHYSTRSSTSYTSPQPSTPRPHPPEMGGQIDHERCGTSAPGPVEVAFQDVSGQTGRYSSSVAGAPVPGLQEMW